MVVVIVEGIEIPPLAGAFPHRPKGDLPQAPQLAQDHRVTQLVASVEVDPLTVRGVAEGLAGFDGLLELTALLRQGDGGFGGQQAPLATPDAIEVAAHQPGRALGGQLLHPAHRDAGTYGDGDALALLAKQLLDQQQPGPVVVEPGGEIEGETVAPVQVDRHQRGAGALSQLDEA